MLHDVTNYTTNPIKSSYSAENLNCAEMLTKTDGNKYK